VVVIQKNAKSSHKI